MMAGAATMPPMMIASDSPKPLNMVSPFLVLFVFTQPGDLEGDTAERMRPPVAAGPRAGGTNASRLLGGNAPQGGLPPCGEA